MRATRSPDRNSEYCRDSTDGRNKLEAKPCLPEPISDDSHENYVDSGGNKQAVQKSEPLYASRRGPCRWYLSPAASSSSEVLVVTEPCLDATVVRRCPQSLEAATRNGRSVISRACSRPRRRSIGYLSDTQLKARREKRQSILTGAVRRPGSTLVRSYDRRHGCGRLLLCPALECTGLHNESLGRRLSLLLLSSCLCHFLGVGAGHNYSYDRQKQYEI